MTTDKRAYRRQWERAKRAVAADKARSGRTTCPQRIGPGICGGILETTVLRSGATTTICPRCERRAAGRCVDCNRAVEGQRGKAMRCADCKKAARRRQGRTYDKRNRDERNARYRRWYHRPEVRAARCEYKKAWRKANKVKVYLQKRRGRLKGSNGYATREKYLAYQNAYNAARAEARRAYMRERYHAKKREALAARESA